MSNLDELITVNLDKERRLRLTAKGIIEFKKLTKIDILKGFSPEDMEMEESLALIWACLLHEDKDLTYDDVLYLVDMSNIAIVMDAVTKCLKQSLTMIKGTSRPLAAKSPHG